MICQKIMLLTPKPGKIHKLIISCKKTKHDTNALLDNSSIQPTKVVKMQQALKVCLHQQTFLFSYIRTTIRTKMLAITIGNKIEPARKLNFTSRHPVIRSYCLGDTKVVISMGTPQKTTMKTWIDRQLKNCFHDGSLLPVETVEHLPDENANI